MSHIALYRKYRPQDFDHVIGQNFIVKTLRLAVENNNLNHAYIFAGTRGTGKTSIAKIFSKAINCLNPQNGDCCNQCANCLAINSNNCVDILELDAASNNGVNEIRSIIDTVNYLPNQLKYKVYIIDEAHMLSTSAWNALLKTIEEPPKHVIFIFATTEFNKIPITIVSRCQRYDFHKLNLEELKNLINHVAKQEDIKITPDAIQKIAMMSDGGARDCLSILDQLCIYTNKNITIDSINTVFGLLDIDKKIELLNILLTKNENDLILFLNDFKKENLDGLALVSDLLNYLLDKVIYLKTKNTNLLKVLTLSDLDKINTSINEAFNLVTKLNEIYDAIKKSSNPQFTLEINLLKLCFSTNEVVDTNSSPIDKKIESSKIVETSKEVIDPTKSEDKLETNLSDTFKTETITNKFNDVSVSKSSKPQEEVETSNEEDFAIRYDDREDFNHLVNENMRPINPYLDKEILKSVSNKDEKVKETIPELDWQDIFFKIAKNNNKEFKEETNELLSVVKNKSSFYSEESKILADADKALIVSNNGIVLLYDFKNEAKKFNQLFWTREGYSKFKALLLNNKDKLIYAVDKKTAKEWTQIYRGRKTEEFPDVSLDLIKDIKGQTSEEMKQNILEILGSTVKIKI